MQVLFFSLFLSFYLSPVSNLVPYHMTAPLPISTIPHGMPPIGPPLHSNSIPPRLPLFQIPNRMAHSIPYIHSYHRKLLSSFPHFPNQNTTAICSLHHSRLNYRVPSAIRNSDSYPELPILSNPLLSYPSSGVPSPV